MTKSVDKPIINNMKILSNQYLSDYTTIRLGSKVRWFLEVENTADFVEAIAFCATNKIPFFVLAGGSNTVFDDNTNVRQAVIHTINWNKSKIIDDFGAEGNSSQYIYLECDPGVSLQSIVDFAMDNELVGVTGLNRIPGTLGGAVVGNAGAYGCEINQSVECVETIRISEINNSQKPKFYILKNQDCQFGYRDTLFKKDLDIMITKIVLKLKKTTNFAPEKEKYNTIAKARDAIYPVGLASPGSLFKNLLYSTLTTEAKELVPKEWVMYGDKLPVGKLLESLNIKGYRIGNITQRPTHANIMINLGGGKAVQAHQIVKDLQVKIWDKYKIKIEPEVRFIPKNFGDF